MPDEAGFAFRALAHVVAIVLRRCGRHSTRGGWFIWPAGLMLFVLLALVFLLARRRR